MVDGGGRRAPTPPEFEFDGAGVHRLGWMLVRFFSTSLKTALTLSSPLRGMSHLL